MWYPFKIKISFKSCTSQLLHMGIHNLSDNLQSWCNVIYAHNTLEQRQIPWKDIERLHTNIQIPWFLMGDFNNALMPQDSLGGNKVHEVEYRDITTIMDKVGLFEKDNIC